MKILTILTSTLCNTKISDGKIISDEYLQPFNHLRILGNEDYNNYEAKHREKRFIFKQFKNVKLGEVWNELKGNKVVSYTIARDFTQVCILSVVFFSNNV